MDKVIIEHDGGGESTGKCFSPSVIFSEKPSSTDWESVSVRIFLNSSEEQGPRFFMSPICWQFSTWGFELRDLSKFPSKYITEPGSIFFASQ